MARVARTGLRAVLLTALVGIAACGGGGDGGGGGCGAPTQDVTGLWWIEEYAVSGTPDCNEYDEYTLTATQSGSLVTVTTNDGRDYTGTMCGSTVVANVPFDFPEDGGTTTVTSLSMTVSGDTVSGTAEWTWTDGFESCSGTTTFTGERI